MRVGRIILLQLVFLAGCQAGWGQPPVAPAAEVASSYANIGVPQPVFAPGAQPYVQSGPVIIPSAPMVGQPMGPMAPVYPQPSALPGTVIVPPPVGVPPAGVAGPQFGPPTIPSGAILDPGMGVPQIAPNPGMPMQNFGPNPILVPVTNEEVAWDQIADVVSDYFTIAREQRINREVGTEGRIDTAPLTGATWLEPYRKDSVGSFNRWESTFQTIRRRAVVRVIPDAAGYLIEVTVEKELEDLPNPEKATAGAAVFRGDDSLPSRRLEDVNRVRSSPRWLQLGRDPLLEQRMLGDIRARLGGAVVR